MSNSISNVFHLELEFCHSGPPTKSTTLFGCPVRIWCRSDICRRRYCDDYTTVFFNDFGSVAGEYLTTLLFGFFWGFESLKIVGCHQHPQKAHPWVKTRHWSHKRLNPSKGSSCGKLPFAPFDRQHTTFYWSAIVNITLTSTVFLVTWRWIISWP